MDVELGEGGSQSCIQAQKSTIWEMCPASVKMIKIEIHARMNRFGVVAVS
jgi:hypothetical protein